MASDLSKLIQDSITLTLNGLLAKDAKILQITQAHPKDLESLKLLKVQSDFNFSNFSSEFSFLVTAKSSSLIFNTMMGSPITDLSEEIDDDAEDAIGEFISNISGSLTTSINGSELEDIGQTKFNIAHKEIIAGESVVSLENVYKFKIDLEGSELILFIMFEESILPYISEICASEVTFYEEVAPIIEETEEEEKIEDIIEKESPSKEDKEEITIDEEATDPKTKKLKLIIIGVASLLGLIVISFIIMYFLGIFDPEPVIEEKIDTNTTKIMNEKNKVEIVNYSTLKKVIFNVSDIDINRLNNKLTELTKYKVLNKEELEAQELAEKNRLFELEREKELLEFSKKNHEEELFEKKEIEKPRIIDKKTKFKEETFPIEKNNIIITNNIPVDSSEKEIITEEKSVTLNYVLSTSLKYSLFKSLVQETTTKQARISICNDTSGKTTIYIGPFETQTLQNTMIELILKNNPTINAESVHITEEEFNTRCNLE